MDNPNSSDMPQINDSPTYLMLRNDQVDDFNAARAKGEPCDLKGCDLRGLDLRGLILKEMDLTNTYFRGTDLRGIDFRGCCLDGASLADAKISGCYFPEQISAQEILLSVTQGTRIRHSCGKKV